MSKSIFGKWLVIWNMMASLLISSGVQAMDIEPTKFWGLYWGEPLQDVAMERKLDDLHFTNQLNTKFYVATFNYDEIVPLPGMVMREIFIVGFADNRLRRIEIILFEHSNDGFERLIQRLIHLYGAPDATTENLVTWYGKNTTMQLKKFPGKKPNLMTLDFFSVKFTREQQEKIAKNK